MEERLCSGPFAHFLRKKALDLELVLQYLSDRARGKGTITSKGFAKSIKMENQRGFFPNCTLQKFSLKQSISSSSSPQKKNLKSK